MRYTIHYSGVIEVDAANHQDARDRAIGIIYEDLPLQGNETRDRNIDLVEDEEGNTDE